MADRVFDVVVIGGGPAGSASATLLARSGHRVALFEAAAFPRFAIGESLIPAAMPVLTRLGLDLARSGHLRKAGAEFYDETAGRVEIYPFADALPGCPDHAFQVDRAPFDAELLEGAARAGVEIHTRTPVVTVAIAAHAVTIGLASGSVSARYVIDASGRNALVSRRWRTPIQGLGRAAAFAHFDDLPQRTWAELSHEGNVRVFRIAMGWAWLIPLAPGRLSVGVVTREKLQATALTDAIASSPMLSRLLEATRSTAPQSVGDWSYRAQPSAGSRWAAVGDAAYFLDPIFSSGVALGLHHAALVADRLAEALAMTDEARPNLMAPVTECMAHAYRCFYILIHRFYHSGLYDNLLLADDPDPQMRAGLITMLAGDVWRDDNVFQNALLAARRGNPELALA